MTKFPKIGLGTAALALADPREAERVLSLALDHGITYFDTAPLYGGGLAEQRLGEVLKSRGNSNTLVSTKVGRFREKGAEPPTVTGNPDTWNFREGAVRESIARSQGRLGRERLDCVFLHDIEFALDQALCEGIPVLMELKQQGIVGAIGAGCNTVEGLVAAINAGADDSVLVAGRWTLLDRSAGKSLLPLCRSKNTSVVAGGVLNSGLLAKRPQKGMKFDYRPATDHELAAATELHDVAEKMNVSLISAALQYPTRTKDVASILIGCSSAEQFSRSLSALAEEIPEAFWDAVADKGLRPSDPQA